MAYSFLLPETITGGLSPTMDGGWLAATEVSSATSIATPASFSTTGSRRLIIAALTVMDGTLPSSISISGSTLGTFTQFVIASNNPQKLTSALYGAWANAQLTNEQITASWTNSNNAMLRVSAWYNARNIVGLTNNVDYASTSATGSTSQATLSPVIRQSGSIVIGNYIFINGYPITTNAGTNKIIGYRMTGTVGYNSILHSCIPTQGLQTYAFGGTSQSSAGIAISCLELIPEIVGSLRLVNSYSGYNDTAGGDIAITGVNVPADALVVVGMASYWNAVPYTLSSPGLYFTQRLGATGGPNPDGVAFFTAQNGNVALSNITINATHVAATTGMVWVWVVTGHNKGQDFNTNSVYHPNTADTANASAPIINASPGSLIFQVAETDQSLTWTGGLDTTLTAAHLDSANGQYHGGGVSLNPLWRGGNAGVQFVPSTNSIWLAGALEVKSA